MEKQSLIRWLKGADEIFEALEGRGDTYNLCRKWVEEWFSCGQFCITDADRKFLNEFKLLIFNEKIKTPIENNLGQLKQQLQNHTNKISFSFSLYLISWNIRRFENYFKSDNNFDFQNYFNSLNEVFNEEFLNMLRKLKKLHLLNNDIDEDLVKKTYKKLHQKLKKIGHGTQNEPVSTIKIMHIIAPFYIPLLDNPIAESLKEEKVCQFFQYRYLYMQEENRYIRYIEIDQDSFLKFMKWIKEKFSPFSDVISSLETEKRKSFLKLFDEALYIRYSIDIGRRLTQIGQ